MLLLPSFALAQTRSSSAAIQLTEPGTTDPGTTDPGTTEPGSLPRTEPGRAAAPSDPELESDSELEDAPPYRNRRGSVVVLASAGIAIGGESTAVAIGAGVGYALVTGVLPSVRALLIFGDGTAGELSLDLTLTPPIAAPLVPFVQGEVGRRFDGAGGAWILAVGGGVYLGDPRSTLNIALGYAYRRYLYENASLNGSGPILAASFSF
ncbi:MAG: hypothetical protein IT384_29455 [Deltaproteobacteria bacterium]|nr:hypothetical protein [Deltaproteobacteria bacterium]